MAIETVDLPNYKMVIFHSKLLVYQRVHPPQQNYQPNNVNPGLIDP